MSRLCAQDQTLGSIQNHYKAPMHEYATWFCLYFERLYDKIRTTVVKRQFLEFNKDMESHQNLEWSSSREQNIAFFLGPDKWHIALILI